MESNASSMTDNAAKPGSSCWDSENMDSDGDNHPAVRENSGYFPTPKENLFSLAAKAWQEGFMAHKAVSECQNIETYAEESAKVAERRSAAARKMAKSCDSLAEVVHNHTTADKLSMTAKLTAKRAEYLYDSIRLAETEAKSAILLSVETFRDLDKTGTKLIPQDTFERLERVKENAIRGITTLKVDEYLALKAMQRCWKTYLPPLEGDTLQEVDADLNTPFIPSDQTDSESCERIPMPFAVILGVGGCIILILNATLSLDESSFLAMLTTGAMCTLQSLDYVISKITQNIITKRKRAYIHRRTAMLKIIDERLAEVTHFFATKMVTVPSDEEAE